MDAILLHTIGWLDLIHHITTATRGKECCRLSTYDVIWITHYDQDRLARQTAIMVENLMGKKAELRYRFIQENAEFVDDVGI